MPALAPTVRAAPEAFTLTVALLWLAGMLLRKLGSPEVKVAVITWLPTVVKECEHVAGLRTPPDTVVVQKVPEPAESLKVIVPVCGSTVCARPVAGAIVAVRVTGTPAPAVAGAVTVVAEAARVADPLAAGGALPA